MTSTEVWAYVGKIAALLGGVGVFAGAVAGFVGKFIADRSLEGHKAALSQETERLKAELGKDTETHRWQLKKKEILFQKEVEAASKFFELHRLLEPKFRHPDMDWYEAADDIVDDFGRSEDKLQKFIAEHGPVLGAGNRAALDECKQIASLHKFAKATGGTISKEDEDAAEKFLRLLDEVEARFVKELRS